MKFKVGGGAKSVRTPCRSHLDASAPVLSILSILSLALALPLPLGATGVAAGVGARDHHQVSPYLAKHAASPQACKPARLQASSSIA